MKMEEIRKIAEEKGISPKKSRKADLIRMIQRAEGIRTVSSPGKRVPAVRSIVSGGRIVSDGSTPG